MKSSKLILTITGTAILLSAKNINAQSVEDAAKYAQTSSFATARSIGFGSALGSVGGDFASLSVNPAGIGIYRSSEVMITPGMRFSGADAKYSGGNFGDNN
ncbi:MAG: TonB-dependent receptor, partial [Chitinophagaceae bacterium]|nr:TonB-dependent receptor [Chitinophagaceae bacterium]